MNNIRNFAIIAHVDHGKSTLADRFLELTGTVQKGKHEEQMLDRNPISRERGITIKLAPVRMLLKSDSIPNFFGLVSSSDYILNLIDTPGHVDFSYEVDRTLACVEGVVLLVDATQGVQAQTIANAYKALEKNLAIIPVINKIDLPSAEPERTKKQLVDFLGVKESEIFEVSAKTGVGVEELLKSVIEKVPSPGITQYRGFSSASPPKGSPKLLTQNQVFLLPKPKIFDTVGVASQLGGLSSSTPKNSSTQALIFDSYYDTHRGVIAFVRVFGGRLKKGSKVKLAHTGVTFEVTEVGYFSPDLIAESFLENGQIGYVITNLKDIHEVNVGDTLLSADDREALSLPGYKKVKPMVFASIFPTDTADYPNLQKALEKLYLNDSSLEFTSIYSQALGAGYRVGFLGLLHADVVRERLEREFDLSLVLTPPQVEFKNNKSIFEEPIVKVMIITPDSFVGPVMQLCQNYRGKFLMMDNKNETILEYELPMTELISDFFDNLKSVSSGYASLDWEFSEYRPVKAGKLDLLLNGDPVDEFSEVVVEERSFQKANFLTTRLKELIPRQQYEVKIQASYKGKIIASTRIAPFRKDVLIKSGKVIGAGDVGRKRKLLEKQKEGKKKMKMVGRVEIPKEAFMKLFRK